MLKLVGRLFSKGYQHRVIFFNSSRGLILGKRECRGARFKRGHRKREKRISTFLRTSMLGIEDCMVTRRFSALIKNNTTKMRMGKFSQVFSVLHYFEESAAIACNTNYFPFN